MADIDAHLRHAEAVLYVVRSAYLKDRHKTLRLPRGEVARAYSDGHGVDLVSDNPTMLEVVPQPGKYQGQ